MQSTTMASKSPVQDAIDTIIRLGPQPMLKGLGFRKIRRSFYIEINEVFRAINFQASQWGTAGAGSVTINLSVKQPYFHQMLTGEAIPRSPTSLNHILGERNGMLMPCATDWWIDIKPRIDTQVIAKQIVEMIQAYAFPYFQKVGGVDQLLQLFERGVFPASLRGGKMAYVILLCFRQRRERAASILKKLRRDPDYASWAPLEEIARRLELV